MNNKQNAPGSDSGSTQSSEQRGTLSRRTFLKVALGSLPAAAFVPGPLSLLWPKTELTRPVAEPWILALHGGMLWDPDDEYDLRVPTLRDWLGVPDTPGPEQDAFLDELILEREGLDSKEEPEEWQSCRDQLVAALDNGLDESDFQDWYESNIKDDAWTTWRELPKEVQARFPIYIVEGEYPGSSFSYLKYDGEIDDLNRGLAAAGINIHVIEQERATELLYPGDPDY